MMKELPFKGTYLVFEGGEGSGKTTQAHLFYDRLRQEFPDRETILTNEPGGSPVGYQIRAFLLDTFLEGEEEEMEPITEAYLFAASRAESLRKIVKPALERGAIVIADRSVYSSLVYQGLGRELGFEMIWRINEVAIGGILADKVILLDIDPESGIKRRGGDLNRLDKEDLVFHQEVRDGYLELFKEEPERFIVVDASPSIEVVAEHVWMKVLPLLGLDETKRELKRGKERE